MDRAFSCQDYRALSPLFISITQGVDKFTERTMLTDNSIGVEHMKYQLTRFVEGSTGIFLHASKNEKNLSDARSTLIIQHLSKTEVSVLDDLNL